MQHYYETTHNDEKQFPIITAHETIEDAISFAEHMGIATIYEVGGAWDTFEQCHFCDEWHTLPELGENHICERCEMAIRDHGGR